MDNDWEDQVRAQIHPPAFLYREESASLIGLASLDDSSPLEERLHSDKREAARAEFITRIWNRQQKRLNDGADESTLTGSKARFETKKSEAEDQREYCRAHEAVYSVVREDILQEAYRFADERGIDPIQGGEEWGELLEAPIGEHFLTREKQDPSAHYGWEFTPAHPEPWEYHSEGGLDKYSTEEENTERPVVEILYQPSADYLGGRVDGIGHIQPRERRVEFSSADRWTGVLEKVQERKKPLAEKKRECERRIAKSTCQIQVIEIMLDRLDEGKEVKPMGEPGDAISDDQEKSSTKSLTPEVWERNAALMHAYVSEYGMPEYLKDFDDLIPEKTGRDKFSHEHTWKKLKKEGYAVSTRKEDLPATLERWAEEFEEKYGVPKAIDAANPLDWPLPFDDE